MGVNCQMSFIDFVSRVVFAGAETGELLQVKSLVVGPVASSPMAAHVARTVRNIRPEPRDSDEATPDAVDPEWLISLIVDSPPASAAPDVSPEAIQAMIIADNGLPATPADDLLSDPAVSDIQEMLRKDNDIIDADSDDEE